MQTDQNLSRLLAELNAAITAGDLSARADTRSLTGQPREIVETVNAMLDALTDPHHALVESLERLARGSLPAALPEDAPGEFGRVNSALNTCCDTLNNVMAEASSLAGAVAQGDLQPQIDLTAYPGEWAVLMKRLHEIAANAARPARELGEALTRLAAGDFTAQPASACRGQYAPLAAACRTLAEQLQALHDTVRDLTGALSSGQLSARAEPARFPGQFADLIRDLNASFTAINLFLDELRALADAVSAGKVQVRANTRTVDGEFAESLHQVNAAFDTLLAPLTTAAEQLERLCRGDAPARIEPEFRGDLQPLQTHLQGVNDFVQDVTRTLERLAEGDHEVAIARRSSRDALTAAVAKAADALREAAAAREAVAEEAAELAADREMLQQVRADTQKLVATLERSLTETRERDWLKTGQARLRQLLQESPQPAAEPPPAQTPSPDQPRPGPETRPTPKPQVLKILVIESDPHLARTLLEGIRERGGQGVLTRDGSAGLQMLTRTAPAAIVASCLLPDMDGWTLLRKLKTDPPTRHLPVSFLPRPGTAADNGRQAAPLEQVAETLDALFAGLSEPGSQAPKHLLIAEPQQADVTNMLSLLGADNMQITTVETGAEVYQLLQTRTFDCLVLNMSLEDMSGFQLLKMLKTSPAIAPLPILLYADRDLSAEERELLQREARRMILKGVKTLKRLADEVLDLLGPADSSGPLAQPPLHQPAAPGHNHVLTGKTVLFVQAASDTTAGLTDMLQAKGLRVLLAPDGVEAAEQLAAHTDIKVVLLDLPSAEAFGQEGVQLVRSQSQARKLPLIVLTPAEAGNGRQAWLQAGVTDMLPKPVDPDRLLSVLRVWLY
jgi:CheY-like chemotaxis protein